MIGQVERGLKDSRQKSKFDFDTSLHQVTRDTINRGLAGLGPLGRGTTVSWRHEESLMRRLLYLYSYFRISVTNCSTSKPTPASSELEQYYVLFG